MKSKLQEMIERTDHPMPFCHMISSKRFWLGLLDALIAITVCGPIFAAVVYLLATYCTPRIPTL